jgi:hypothetical protein
MNKLGLSKGKMHFSVKLDSEYKVLHTVGRNKKKAMWSGGWILTVYVLSAQYKALIYLFIYL